MVLILLLTGFGVEAHLPRPAFWKRFTARTRFKSSTLSIYGSSAMIGLLTPLLPCSPLYMIFGASMLAGSAAKGAEFTLAFGLGTTPLLWLAQHQFHRLRAKINPRAMLKLRRGLAIITALILAWRLHGTLDFPWLQADEKPKELPSCCH
jgi:sulfite exporter TauE/SafE